MWELCERREARERANIETVVFVSKCDKGGEELAQRTSPSAAGEIVKENRCHKRCGKKKFLDE